MLTDIQMVREKISWQEKFNIIWVEFANISILNYFTTIFSKYGYIFIEHEANSSSCHPVHHDHQS